MKRSLAAAALLACVAAALWYDRTHQQTGSTPMTGGGATARRVEWLDRLYSRNPAEAAAAAQQVTALGPSALPVIRDVLQDQQSEAERLKAALKASGILGKAAAPIIPDVVSLLHEPGLTAEAALALSYMGPDAFEPLSDARSSADPIVRREALRSIGKLKDRAPLEGRIVVPRLVEAMKDPDQTVRAVAATYLGILHEQPDEAIPVLIAGLQDQEAEVRLAAATALGSFGPAAAPALPALKKAATDPVEDVAREAGRSIVKLQQK